MVRETLKIRTDLGLPDNPAFHDIEITAYEFKPQRMGMPVLTATLMWDECLDGLWTGAEYVELRGERFYIRHTPSSSKSNTDARYRHEIEFRSDRDEILSNVYFEDYVPASGSITADKPCSNSPTFTFYGTIREFSDRLNCAFLKAGVGDSVLKSKTDITTLDKPSGDGYCSAINPYGNYDLEKSYDFSFDRQFLWEAITEAYNKTEIPFEIKGRMIIWGSEQKTLDHTFRYGFDSELLSVSKNNANAKVVNRVTMLGSAENIPHFYPNETEYGHISVKGMPGNKVLKDSMIEVVNRSQMLARMQPDTPAVLCKYAEGDNAGSVSQYLSGFDGTLSAYSPGTVITHYSTGSPEESAWNIGIRFGISKAGYYSVTEIMGTNWRHDAFPDYTSDGSINLIWQVRGIDSLLYASDRELRSQTNKTDRSLDLGYLEAGDYYLRFNIGIDNIDPMSGKRADMSCVLRSVNVAEHAPQGKEGYYWEYAGRFYDGLGSLGVRIGDVSDSMVGDGFMWTATGRMPFQDRLVPPKYRDTLGRERFYNAVNGAYTDPDTNRHYVFPNPYKEGAPSEYIYENEDIKPTIEGIRNASGQLLGSIAAVAYDDDDNDSLKPDSTDDSDKNDSLKYEHSYFYIRLNRFDGEYGFNLFDHASQTDPMTIQMTSGPCNGCRFKIQVVEYEDGTGLKTQKNPVQTDSTGGLMPGSYDNGKTSDSNFIGSQQDTSKNSVWLCVQKDADTFGVIMPNREHKYFPKPGDTFNIINIDLPDAYIRAAEKRLEEEGIRYMSDNNEEKFTFDINASRIFFAENPEVLAELDEYSRIRVEYDGQTYELYVSSLTISCKEGEPLPEVRIELTDTLAVGQGFEQRIEERMQSLIANAAGGGSGTGLNFTLADLRYLNKMKSDRTPYDLSVGGNLTSERWAKFGKFIQGFSGAAIDPYGNAEVESIVVRSYMKVFELIYNRINALEGDTSFADSGTIETIVENGDGSYTAVMRRRWEGDFTAFQEGDVIYGYVNSITTDEYGNLSDNSQTKGGYLFYKAWALVKSVDRGNNTLVITKYSDIDVPGQRNFPMVDGMMISRWGNALNPEDKAVQENEDFGSFIVQRGDKWINTRQQSFFISTEQGNLVELMGVDKPILERGNYGVVLGQIPEGLLDEETMRYINAGQPYLYARGIIVQDLIRIGYEGVTVKTPNMRGYWNEETAKSETDYYRSTEDTVDVVSWDGALWQCVSQHANEDPPSDSHPDWIRLTSFSFQFWYIVPSVNTIHIRQNSYSTNLLECTVVLQTGDGETKITRPEDLDPYNLELVFSLDGESYGEFWVRDGEKIEGTGLDIGGNNVPWVEIQDNIWLVLRDKDTLDVKDGFVVPVTRDGESIEGPKGDDGVDGSHTEQRFKVVSSDEQDAPVLTRQQKTSRDPEGWSINQPGIEVFQDLWMIQATIDAKNGLVGEWSDPVRITGHDGKTGNPGLQGLLVYPAGVYNSAVTYKSTDGTSPVVMDGRDSAGTGQYYMLKRDKVYWGNDPSLAANRRTPAEDYANYPDSQRYWDRFDSFKLIYADILMADFAKLSWAVFKDEFMFSQGGYLPDGTYTEEDYRTFGQGFEPNFQIDFRTGHVIARDMEYYGFVRQKLIRITDANYHEYYDDLAFGISWEKAGASIWLEKLDTSLPHSILLPTLNSTYSSERLERGRAYVGNTILIFNTTSRDGVVRGNFLKEVKTNTTVNGHRAWTTQTVEDVEANLPTGCVTSFTCRLHADENGYEQLYWEVGESCKIIR